MTAAAGIQEILRLKLKDFFVQNGTAELHIIGKGNKFPDNSNLGRVDSEV